MFSFFRRRCASWITTQLVATRTTLRMQTSSFRKDGFETKTRRSKSHTPSPRFRSDLEREAALVRPCFNLPFIILPNPLTPCSILIYPRLITCISLLISGKRIAHLELQLALSKICQNFWVASTGEDIKPYLRTLLTPGNSVPIEFIDRWTDEFCTLPKVLISTARSRQRQTLAIVNSCVNSQ